MPSSSDDEDLLEPTQPANWGDTVKEEPQRRHSSIQDRFSKRRATSSLLLKPFWITEEPEPVQNPSPDPQSQKSHSEPLPSSDPDSISPVSTPTTFCKLGSQASHEDKLRAIFSPHHDFAVNEIVLIPRSTPGLFYGRIITLDTDKRLATILLSDIGGVQKILPFVFLGKLIAAEEPHLTRTKACQIVEGARNLFDLIYTNPMGSEQDTRYEKHIRLTPTLIRLTAYLLFHHVQLIAQMVGNEDTPVYQSSLPSTRTCSECKCAKSGPSYDTDDLQKARSLRIKVMDLLQNVIDMEEKVTNCFIAADK